MLGLDGCEATVMELGVAADLLSRADNIDSRCQPFLINVHDREKVLLPFVDPEKTKAVCGQS